MSIRSKQLQALISMLNLNQPVQVGADSMETSASSGDGIWKVLIYDTLGQDVISPLLRISDLRENGVTVQMHLSASREPIPDAPAVYFLAPTAENVHLLSEDIEKHLYDSFFINFSSSLSRPLLEDLASRTLQCNSQSLVSQVYDQYLNFVSLEDNLFSLNMKDSYFALNSPSASESSIEELVNQIVSGLYSVIVTSGSLPIIKCSRGNAAEMIARKLDSRLRDQIMNSRTDLFNDGAGVTRPVLVLLDRNLHLPTMLHHSWTYQSLVHDVLDFKLNRVSFASSENNRVIKKTYDISNSDFFWAQNSSKPFPEMAQNVDEELSKYTKEVEGIAKSCGVDSLDEISLSDPTTSAQSLKMAISMLPKLTERKRTIDMHMNIASALLKVIKERSIDELIVVEESISRQTKSQIIEFIKSSKGMPSDKLRLFLLYFLSLEQDMSKEDLNDFTKALEAANCELEPVEYIRSMVNMKTVTNSSLPPSTKSTDFLGKFSSFGNKFADNIKDSGLGSTLGSLITSMKNINFIPASTDSPITKMIENVMDGSFSSMGLGSTSSDEDLLQFDPKLGRSKTSSKGKLVFSTAFVFMVGGGNYSEYQNLVQLSRRLGNDRTIVYGATEILNADEFLRQLTKMKK